MKQKIEQLIAQNLIEPAIELLFQVVSHYMKIVPEDDIKPQYNALIMISGRYQSILQEQKVGIIRFDDANVAKAQVRNSLLASLSDLPAAVYARSEHLKLQAAASKTRQETEEQEKQDVEARLELEQKVLQEDIKRQIEAELQRLKDLEIVNQAAAQKQKEEAERLEREQKALEEKARLKEEQRQKEILEDIKRQLESEVQRLKVEKEARQTAEQKQKDDEARLELEQRTLQEEQKQKKAEAQRLKDLGIVKLAAERNRKAETERLELERKATISKNEPRIQTSYSINENKQTRNNKTKIYYIAGVALIAIVLFISFFRPTSSSTFNYEVVYVAGGTFQMGSNDFSWEKPIHSVTLTNFSIGKYEVTQGQWKSVMGESIFDFKDNDSLPVEQVSWNDIQIFIKKVKEQTGKTYRLPTEAEWEFAARGGNKSKDYQYAGSNEIEEVAWFNTNSQNETHMIGLKKANELGIHDMTGNVYEWCQDYFSGYKGSINIPDYTGLRFVCRGGSWKTGDQANIVTRRISAKHNYKSSSLGFRLVLVPSV